MSETIRLNHFTYRKLRLLCCNMLRAIQDRVDTGKEKVDLLEQGVCKLYDLTNAVSNFYYGYNSAAYIKTLYFHWNDLLRAKYNTLTTRDFVLRDLTMRPCAYSFDRMLAEHRLKCNNLVFPAYAVNLAKDIYDRKDWGALPILADMVEEQNMDEKLVAHLRQPNYHRGYWGLDLISGYHKLYW